MRAFPGPLGKYVPTEASSVPVHWPCRARPGRCSGCCSPSVCSFCRDDTHKVDVINFAQNKATKCLQNENLIDKESASLLWSFIVLLCRQNGVRVSPPRASLLVSSSSGILGPQEDQAGFLGQAFLSGGAPQEAGAQQGAWFGVKGGLASPLSACPACAVCPCRSQQGGSSPAPEGSDRPSPTKARMVLPPAGRFVCG